MSLLGDVFAGFSDRVRDAWLILTHEERAALYAGFDDKSGEFLGLGFTDPASGKFTKFTDPARSWAVSVLEEQYRSDMIRLHGSDNCNVAGVRFYPVDPADYTEGDTIDAEFTSCEEADT